MRGATNPVDAMSHSNRIYTVVLMFTVYPKCYSHEVGVGGIDIRMKLLAGK
jgi:hypothetical protein